MWVNKSCELVGETATRGRCCLFRPAEESQPFSPSAQQLAAADGSASPVTVFHISASFLRRQTFQSTPPACVFELKGLRAHYFMARV